MSGPMSGLTRQYLLCWFTSFLLCLLQISAQSHGRPNEYMLDKISTIMEQKNEALLFEIAAYMEIKLEAMENRLNKKMTNLEERMVTRFENKITTDVASIKENIQSMDLSGIQIARDAGIQLHGLLLNTTETLKQDTKEQIELLTIKIENLEDNVIEAIINKSTSTQKVSLCLPPFKRLPETDECIYVRKEQLSWDNARKECNKMGADLAVPTDTQALAKFLSTIPKDVRGSWFYVGGNDRASPGTKFSWINGEKVTGPWYRDNPDFDQEDNCLIVNHNSGDIADHRFGCASSLSYSHKVGYICQKV